MSRKAKPVKAIKKSFRKVTKFAGLSRRESKAFARELGDIGHDVTVNVATEYTIRALDTVGCLVMYTASGIIESAKSATKRAKKLQGKKVNLDIDVDIIEDYDCDVNEEVTDVT